MAKFGSQPMKSRTGINAEMNRPIGRELKLAALRSAARPDGDYIKRRSKVPVTLRQSHHAHVCQRQCTFT